MKKVFILFILTGLLVACKKEINTFKPADYLSQVRKSLRDSLSAADYSSLDFPKSVLSKVDSVNLYILRIPFNGKSVAEDFVVVKTNKEGQVEKGKIIHQEGAASDVEISGGRRKSFNGHISISSLDRKTVLTSGIEDGYITALHSATLSRTALVQAGDVMPEVVITYILPSSGGFSWSFWMDLQSYFYDGGGDSWGNYYGSMDGGGGPTGGGGPYGDPYSGGPGHSPVQGDGGGPAISNPILIDVETMDEDPGIDVEKFISCFNAIPDAGATCSIEIMADVPVDSDPEALFNMTTGSPGHTFVSISKNNGTQHVTQNIGFYPAPGYKSITFLPTGGKVVNNAGHEFNASLSMALTPAQLRLVLNKVLQSSTNSYVLADYNCTDWALGVFNVARTTPLEIPTLPIIGMYSVSNASMPQGLYKKFKQMKDGNDPEKSHITIDIIKGYAGGSTGPCN